MILLMAFLNERHGLGVWWNPFTWFSDDDEVQYIEGPTSSGRGLETYEGASGSFLDLDGNLRLVGRGSYEEDGRRQQVVFDYASNARAEQLRYLVEHVGLSPEQAALALGVG